MKTLLIFLLAWISLDTFCQQKPRTIIPNRGVIRQVYTDPVTGEKDTTDMYQSNGQYWFQTNADGFNFNKPIIYNGVDLTALTDTSSELVSRTIYVSMPTDPQTPGSDVTGDGTVSKPFATINRALKSIKSVLRAQIYLQLDSGAFDLTINDYKESERFTCNPYIKQGETSDLPFIINGKIEQVATVTLTRDNDTLFKYVGAGVSWTPDQWEGYFIKLGNSYYPIESNTSNRLLVSYNAGTITGAIYKLTSTLNCEQYYTGSINNFMQNLGKANFYAIRYRYINFTTGTGTSFYHIGNPWPYHIQISTCSFVSTANTQFISATAQGGQSKRIQLVSSFIKNTNAGLTNAMIYDPSGNINLQITGCVFKGGINNKALFLSPFTFCNVVFSVFSNLTCPYINGSIKSGQPNVYKSLTNLIEVSNLQNFSFMEGAAGIYENVTNLLRLSYAGYPSAKVKIISPGGWTNVFNSASLYKNKFKIPGLDINIPGTYPEIEIDKTYTLTNNATDSISIADLTYNRIIAIDYTITRGTSFSTGTIKVLNKNAAYDIDISTPIGDDVGVTFNGVYKSGATNILKLKWTTTNTGTNATISMDLRRQNY